MDKKKLQRIIGISVIVAFVIVLIPFLFGKREVQQQELNTAATIEGPASTNDANQTNVSENNANTTPTDTNNPGAQNTSSAEDNGITPITTPASPPVAQNETPVPTGNTPADMNNQAAAPSATPAGPATTMNNPANTATNPSSAAPTTSPTAAAAPVAAEGTTPPAEDNVQMAPAVSTDAADTVHPQATAEPAAVTTPVQTAKPHHVHKSLIVKKTSHLSQKSVTDLKKPAWVVQMGSFKEKSNAHRMVNQLRSSGFKAFTHVVTSPSGIVRTRVYIGPEFKQASAVKLSNKVEQEVKLRGFVVPYKPMAL